MPLILAEVFLVGVAGGAVVGTLLALYLIRLWRETAISTFALANAKAMSDINDDAETEDEGQGAFGRFVERVEEFFEGKKKREVPRTIALVWEP